MTLVISIGMLSVLSISTATAIEYTTSNTRSAEVDMSKLDAAALAQGALNHAYAILNKWDYATSTGNNATDPTLLGCDSNGANCVPKCASIVETCPTASSTGVHGTGSFYGSYDATLAIWTIKGTGYARNPSSPSSAMLTRTLTAKVKIIADINDPANVAVWNHIFSTAPPGAGCEFDIANNYVYVDIPVYVNGDMCLRGTNNRVMEDWSGQAVDLRVGGKLVLSGSGASIGYNDDGDIYPISSAGIGQGCATNIANTPTSCTGGGFAYYVDNNMAFEELEAPVIDPTWYANADPGPSHTCKAGSNKPYTPGTMTPIASLPVAAPLAATVFESAGSTVADGSAAAFDLTPTTSYTCLSQTGSGQLSWDYPNRKLYISGVVYIDGDVSISRSGSYDGIGSLYVDTFTMGGSFRTFCAHSSCSSSWNPNTEMLMIVARGAAGTAVNFSGSFNGFQGGLFAPETATIALSGSSAWIRGPLVAGRFTLNQYTVIQPLPAINGLPPGAPLAVNARAVPQTPSYAE